MFQTATNPIPPRMIDPNAIDITSLKGRFAWEKIPLSDIYMPVIFRGDTKYFCVRMLRKLLADYPEDVIRRSSLYQYRKPIDLYHVTPNEIDLLNRINRQHARCLYSRQSFTAVDEIIRVTDFLPFYEHLRRTFTSGSAAQAIANTYRQVSSHPPQSIPRPTAPVAVAAPPATSSGPRQPYPSALERYLENPPPMHKRSTLPVPSILRPHRPMRPTVTNPSAGPLLIPTIPAALVPSPPQAQLVPMPSVISPPPPPPQPVPAPPMISPHQVQPIPPVTSPPQAPTVASPIESQPAPARRVPSVQSNNSPIVTPSNTPLTVSTRSNDSSSSNPSTSASSPVSSSSSSNVLQKVSPTSKTTRLLAGWIQINKLYTPYVTNSVIDHHHYKIPVSLLSFYHLIDADDPLKSLEQTLVTPEELDLINDLCFKHSIRAFPPDTKMISLATFYEHTSANMIFIKELPLNEPKASICKEWLSIVQINGGICRLRNISTLHEQTVPFVGNNLLKCFIVSTHCLSTANLTKPTPMECEFLQMILFFSNLSVNLRHAQFIDLDSVKKEYSVDLILLFNDKFPLNVLNYQQAATRPTPSNSSAPSNTIAESTPPPSPPSPVAPTNPNPTPSAQLPLTSSTNRYHKTIDFHGHSLTAYICSGLDSNNQRECVSIKSLCQIICPSSHDPMEKLELKMLKLLRAKNINRYRPQNQQSMGFTRLIDIRDAEKFWDYLERGMLSSSNATGANSIEGTGKSSGKRRHTDDQALDDDEVPVLERLSKRLRANEKENKEQEEEEEEIPEISLSVLAQAEAPIENEVKKTKKTRTPATRPKKGEVAEWMKKYQLEECSVLVDRCRLIGESNGKE